jgi:Zn-dependent protease with chaperone function
MIIRGEQAIKILRGFQVVVFGMAALCVMMAGKASAQTIDPNAVREAAQTVAGLNAAELLALVALACVALAFYLVWSVQREIKLLNRDLSQRPCIRNPKNN